MLSRCPAGLTQRHLCHHPAQVVMVTRTIDHQLCCWSLRKMSLLLFFMIKMIHLALGCILFHLQIRPPFLNHSLILPGGQKQSGLKSVS